MESRISFNGKVEKDMEVFVEGKVGNIKRTIGDSSEAYRFEGLNSFYI